MSLRSPESVNDRIPTAGPEAVQFQTRVNLSHEFVESKSPLPSHARSGDRSSEHSAGQDLSLRAFGHLTLVHGEQASASSTRPEPTRGGNAQPDKPVAPRGAEAAQPGRSRSADEPGPRSPGTETKGEQPVVKEYLDVHKKSTYPDGVRVSESPERIGADSSQSKLVKFLSDPTNHQAVDYARIANESGSGPILIGDSHRSVATKRDFIASLPDLKRAGVQEIDLELLPAAMQKQLDYYTQLVKNSLSSPESISAEHKKLVDHFRRVWDGGPDEKTVQRTAERLAGIVEGIIKAGLRPVGIEPPVEGFFHTGDGVDFFHHGLERLTKADQATFNKFWDDNASAEEKSQSNKDMQTALRRSGWSAEKTEKFGRILDQMKAGNPPLNLSGLKLPMQKRDNKNDNNKRFEDTLLAWRNDNWVPIIEGQIHSNKKVAVFAGGGHFGNAEEDETISGLLEKRGINSITVMKTGGDLEKVMRERKAEAIAHRFDFEPMPPELHSSAATEAGVSGKRFAYRLDPHKRRQADYVIHLPNE